MKTLLQKTILNLISTVAIGPSALAVSEAYCSRPENRFDSSCKGTDAYCSRPENRFDSECK